MKQGWGIKKLGEVCEILNGYAFKSEKYTSEGVRVLRITNVQKGYVVDDDPKFYPKDEMASLQQYVLKENDVLMSLTGNVGRVGLLQKEMLPAALNQRVACLRIKNEQLYINYLFHFLNSDKFENDAIFSASGIAQKNMSTEWLKKYTIPVPPREEQERIVAELDCLSGVIERKREQLRELDALAQSIFYQMFGDPITNEKGWDILPFNEVADVVGGSTPKTNIEEYWNGDNYWATPAELHGERYIYSTERSITDDAVNKTHLTLLPIGTVLLSSRAPIGKVCITRVPMYCNQGFKNIICSDRLHCEYVYQFLFEKTEYLNSLGTGATFKEISKRVVEQITIPVPPMGLQYQFAERIDRIEQQKELIKKSISETETLFNARMDYYFN